MRISIIPIAMLASAFLAAPAAMAGNLSEAERTALHVAMTQHIDRQVIDGMYLKVDLGTGVIQRFAPAKAHPMVLKMGEDYVLCTDFKNEAGVATNVDFYVTRRGKGFAIFHTEINNRQPLMKLMEAGKVVAAE